MSNIVIMLPYKGVSIVIFNRVQKGKSSSKIIIFDIIFATIDVSEILLNEPFMFH